MADENSSPESSSEEIPDEVDSVNKSTRQKMTRSGNITLVLSIFSSLLYLQDIFQDVLVTVNSLSSAEEYNVLFSLRIKEQKFGFAMISIICTSILVVGLDTMMRLNQLVCIKKCMKMYVVAIFACTLNLGPVFTNLMKVSIR